MGTESVTMGGSEARFGSDLDWKKLWRDQGFRGQDAREKMELSLCHIRRIQKQRLAPKVRPGEAKMVYFITDADGRKRLASTKCDQGGSSLAPKLRNGNQLWREPGGRGQDERDKWKQTAFF